MKVKMIILIAACMFLVGMNIKECSAEVIASLFGSETMTSNVGSTYDSWLPTSQAALRYPTINGTPSENGWTVKAYTSMTTEGFIERLKISHIVILRGHGTSDSNTLYIDKDDNGNAVCLKESDLKNYNFSTCYLCVLGTCYSGNGDNSMANLIYNHKAECVIGFKSKIYHPAADKWTKNLCAAIGQHYSIKNALIMADNAISATKFLLDVEKERIYNRKELGNINRSFSASVSYK